MIELSIAGHIATLTLQRPPVNALNDELIERLHKSLDEIDGRDDVSVLHLRSDLKVFCAGADLAMMRDLLTTSAGRDAIVDMIRDLQRVTARLERMPAITVVELGGAALGGGLELALACDLRIAADTAKLGLPEVSLGLVPGAGGTQRLPRVCGEAVARRLILGAEVVDGNEAARLGLVQWVVSASQLEAWTAEFLSRLAPLPREAVIACKACIAAARDDSLDGYALELQETRRLYDVEATLALVQAFLEKTK